MKNKRVAIDENSFLSYDLLILSVGLIETFLEEETIKINLSTDTLRKFVIWP